MFVSKTSSESGLVDTEVYHEILTLFLADLNGSPYIANNKATQSTVTFNQLTASG